MVNSRIFIALLVFALALPATAVADGGDRAYERARDLDRNNQSEKAVEALQEAIEAGHLRAHNTLGYMYWKGDGVDRDVERARELLTVAAEKDLDIAQYQLGELIMETQGDAAEAVKWYERAARQGHVISMSKLADTYADDDNGIETNYPLAHAWYLLAKQSGGYVSNGKLNLLQRKMSRDEQTEAENLYKELAEVLS